MRGHKGIIKHTLDILHIVESVKLYNSFRVTGAKLWLSWSLRVSVTLFLLRAAPINLWTMRVYRRTEESHRSLDLQY